MGEVKRIDFKSGQFEANGKTYYIQLDKLSYYRYQIYESMGVGISFGISFKEIFEIFHKIYKLATTGDSTINALHNIANISYNQMKAIEEGGDQDMPIPDEIKFCTLFCNTENEDLTTWNESLMKRKSGDWRKEGIAMEDFFFLANNAIEGYVKAFSVSRDLTGLNEIKNKTNQSNSPLSSTKTGSKKPGEVENPS